MYAVTAWMVQPLTGILVGTNMEKQQKNQTQLTIRHNNKTEKRALDFQLLGNARLKLLQIESKKQMGASNPSKESTHQKCPAKIDAHLLYRKQQEERERLLAEQQKKRETLSYSRQPVKNIEKPVSSEKMESRLEQLVSNKLCLTLVTYRDNCHVPIDVKHWPVIKRNLNEMIRQKICDATHGCIPQFEMAGFYKGFILISCSDDFSKQIFLKWVPKLKCIKDTPVVVLRASRINGELSKIKQIPGDEKKITNCKINQEQYKIETVISGNVQKELLPAAGGNASSVPSTGCPISVHITSDFSASNHPQDCSNDFIRYNPSNIPNRDLLVSKRPYDYEMELQRQNPKPLINLSAYKEPRNEKNLAGERSIRMANYSSSNFPVTNEKESSTNFEKRSFKAQSLGNYGPFNEKKGEKGNKEDSQYYAGYRNLFATEKEKSYSPKLSNEMRGNSLVEFSALPTRENYGFCNEGRFGSITKEAPSHTTKYEHSFDEGRLRKRRPEDSAKYEMSFSANKESLSHEMKRNPSAENSREKEKFPPPERYGLFNEDSLRRKINAEPQHSTSFVNLLPPKKQSFSPHTTIETKGNPLIQFPSNSGNSSEKKLFERRGVGEKHAEDAPNQQSQSVLEKRIYEALMSFKEDDLPKPENDLLPVTKLKRKLETLKQNTAKKPAAEIVTVSSDSDSDGEKVSVKDMKQDKSDYSKCVEYLRTRSVRNINSLSDDEISKYEKLLKSLMDTNKTNSSKSPTSRFEKFNSTNKEETPQCATNNSTGYVIIPEKIPKQSHNSDLEIAIVDRNNEDLNINPEFWIQIEKSLLENLAKEMERTGNTNIGKFDDMPWQYGIKVVKCENLESLNFIRRFIYKQNIRWNDKHLDVIPVRELPKRSVIKLSIPPPYLEDNVVLKLLKGQNYSFNSGDWTLLNSCESPNKNSKDYYLSISSSSLEKLKLGKCFIRYGTNTLKALLPNNM